MRGKVLAAAMTVGVTLATLAAHDNVHGAAAAACRVQGVWDRVGTMQKGKWVPISGFQQRKVVTKHRFMWLNQALRRDTLPLSTALDSARVFRVSGGSGTYTVKGRSYTEHVDMFSTPSFIGQDVTFTCKTEGNRWYHGYQGGMMGSDTTVEVWQRVE